MATKCSLEVSFDNSKNLILCQRGFLGSKQSILIPNKSLQYFVFQLMDFKKQWDSDISETPQLDFDLKEAEFELSNNAIIKFSEGVCNERIYSEDRFGIYWRKDKDNILSLIPLVVIVLPFEFVNELVEIINQGYDIVKELSI